MVKVTNLMETQHLVEEAKVLQTDLENIKPIKVFKVLFSIEKYVLCPNPMQKWVKSALFPL